MIGVVAVVVAVAVGVALALVRPRFPHNTARVGPATALGGAVFVLVIAGDLHGDDVVDALGFFWRPLIVISSLMITAAVARRVGLVTALADAVDSRVRTSALALLCVVFALGAVLATLLNNDAAVVLLTPVVVSVVRRRYPSRPDLIAPFAFAVFLAAGVAPLIVSNPMNMIAASRAGIGFVEYARTMAPVAAVASISTLIALALLVRRQLASAPAPSSSSPPAQLEPRAIALLVVVAVAALAYFPIAASGHAVWPVTVAGAGAALVVAGRQAPAGEVVKRDVSWSILAFLFLVLLFGIALKNAGAASLAASVYADAGPFEVGVLSALGSALVNNHCMSILNVMSLVDVAHAGHPQVLAALVGGDLGPRLLPIGSLAGLLWLSALRKDGVDISLRRFITIGVVVTVPALATSLAILQLG